MNFFARFIHRTVIKLNLEEFFVGLRGRVNFIRKFVPIGIRHKFSSVGRFIPNPQSYSTDDSYLLTRDHTHFRINRSDYVQWRLFYGIRDHYLREAIKAAKPNSIVLDIGANFGAFTLRLATHVFRKNLKNVQVHAFEPNPGMVEKIKDNLSLNPELSDIVKIHSIGMGNKKERVPFHYEASNSGAGRVTKSESTNAMFVNIERVDDFVTDIKPDSVSFIKMIVEGFEPLVFKGAYRTIQTYKPPIFFEVTPEWYKENDTSLAEIIGPLKAFGYTLYGEIHNELIPYNPLRFGPLNQYNMFAVVER